MSLRWMVLATAALVSLGGLSPALAQEAEAEALIGKGVALRRLGQHEQALPYFERAYGMFPTSRSNAQLGFAKAAVGRAIEAERHVAGALADESDPWVRKNKTIIVKALSEIRASLAQVVVVVDPPTAEVKVNDSALSAMQLGNPVYVMPGKAKVVAREPGFVTEMHTLDLVAGGTERLHMVLQRAAGGMGVVGRPADPAGAGGGGPIPQVETTGDGPVDQGRGQRMAGLTLLGTGAVAIGAGALCLRTAGQKIDAIERDARNNVAYDEANGNYRTFNVLSGVLFATGAAAAAGGGWLYFTGRSTAGAGEARIGLFPARVAGATGMAVSGSF